MAFSLLLICCFVASVVSRNLPGNENLLDSKTVGQRNSEGIDVVIWSKLEPIPLQDLEGNKSDHEKIPIEWEQNFAKDNEKSDDGTRRGSSSVKNEELKLEREMAIFCSSEQITLNECPIGIKQENSSTNSSDTISELSLSLNSNELDITEHSIGLDSLADSDAIESTDMGTEMEFFKDVSTSDAIESTDVGTEMEFFQDVSTLGFEFLLNSETTQNLLLTELVSSTSFLISEDDGDSDDDTILKGTNFTFFREGVPVNVTSDATTTVEPTETETQDVKKSTNSVEKLPVCPPPGWCLFWFAVQDTCAKDSHCLGSRICCKSGCAMTCLEVDS